MKGEEESAAARMRREKVKIDVAIADDQLDEVIDVVSKAAYTGKIGDGKIFVAELQRVIRIRTGESDEAAL